MGRRHQRSRWSSPDTPNLTSQLTSLLEPQAARALKSSWHSAKAATPLEMQPSISRHTPQGHVAHRPGIGQRVEQCSSTRMCGARDAADHPAPIRGGPAQTKRRSNEAEEVRMEDGEALCERPDMLGRPPLRGRGTTSAGTLRPVRSSPGSPLGRAGRCPRSIAAEGARSSRVNGASHAVVGSSRRGPTSEASIVSTWSTAADDQSPAIHGLRPRGLRGPRRCRSR